MPFGFITVCAPPLYSIVLALVRACKVPEFVKAPAILIILDAAGVKAPLLMVTLLKLVVPDMVAAAFVNSTVLDPALKVPVFCHAPVLPPIVSDVLVPPFKTPPVSILMVLMVVLAGKVGLSAVAEMVMAGIITFEVAVGTPPFQLPGMVQSVSIAPPLIHVLVLPVLLVPSVQYL